MKPMPTKSFVGMGFVIIMKPMPTKLFVVPNSSSLADKRSSPQRNGASPSSTVNNSKKVFKTEQLSPTVLAANTNQTTAQSLPEKNEWLHKYNNKFILRSKKKKKSPVLLEIASTGNDAYPIPSKVESERVS